jgi:predicted nucleic acid-binding protein
LNLKSRPNALAHAAGVRRLLAEVRPLALDFSILERYANLRLRMRRPHGSGLIGDIDTLITATALEHNATVVTTDQDFLRVPDLAILLLDRPSLTAVNQP